MTQITTPPPRPVAIDGGLLTSGMTFNGQPVRRIKLEWDGGSLETLLPTGGATCGVQKRVLDALRSSPTPLPRKAIARAIGLTGVGGRFSVAIRHLLQTGEIVERSGEIADDPAKFGADEMSAEVTRSGALVGGTA